ncbi:MAG TPA: phosphate ABC transporter ATP-binding protein [Verrucomicrobiales bacterium]|nr:phosphate ABC transporter ATP-binding protein [Verrucomicrobiales bacterium]
MEATAPSTPLSIRVRDLDFFYGPQQALDGVSLDMPRQRATALIGPSGCGKSTLLRCFNRMNDRIPDAVVRRGCIEVEGRDVLAPGLDVVSLRREVGMVFQKSNPFPLSVFENVAYGLRVKGESRADYLEHVVEESLRAAALWDEVKDQLHSDAGALSGGQQQRLCIARAIALRPRVLLMDEPCSALDPVATARVEELIHGLKRRYTVVIVTHNMQQAMRTSDFTAFFYMGRLIEHAPTQAFFENPREKMSQDYVTGRFG